LVATFLGKAACTSMGVGAIFGSTSRTERLRKGEFSGPRVAARIAANRSPTMS
jgi:hypothetical protein